MALAVHALSLDSAAGAEHVLVGSLDEHLIHLISIIGITSIAKHFGTPI